MLEIDKIYCGDCLQVMKDIEDKSINLIIVDPPYNIGKDSWDKIDKYIEWCQSWITECQRVLKDNGSFYLFHNDFMQIIDLARMIRDKTRFVFKQFITWNKRFDYSKNKGFLDGYVAVNVSRNYNQMAEYILFYTFQDETGLSKIMLDTNNFPTIRKYFYELLCYIGETNKSINNKLGHRKAEHCFRYGSTQWDMPTPETYQELIDTYEINQWQGFREYESLRLEYESLRLEYESLRLEYESLRYTFNNQKTHHSVWNYDIESNAQHPTQKPQPLIENIIRHSSNEGDLILDSFIGSGTTAVVCVNLNRHFIGIEKDASYFAIAEKRVKDAQAQLRLF